VADEFKKKYYDVLSNNPRLFARFFKDDSTLTVALADAQPPQSGNGPEVRSSGCTAQAAWHATARAVGPLPTVTQPALLVPAPDQPPIPPLLAPLPPWPLRTG
jgi:hypothetical protein